MEFINIPEDVWYEHLLKYLSWNDLLRFRRISKLTKSVTDDFIRNGKTRYKGIPRNVEIEINETDKTMESFIKLGFPPTRLFVNNSKSGMQFFEDPKMPEFLKKFGDTIRLVHVKQLSFDNPKEKEFYEKISHLNVIHVDDVIAIPDYLPEMGKKKHFSPKCISSPTATSYNDGGKWISPHPNNLWKLRGLIIGRDSNNPKKFDHRQVIPFYFHASAADYIAPPFFAEEYGFRSVPVENYANMDTMLSDMFCETIVSLYARKQQHDDNYNLKVYDFCNYGDMSDEMAGKLSRSEIFLEFLDNLAKSPAQLKHVPAALLQNFVRIPGDNFALVPIGPKIFSLVGLHPTVMAMELPKLEKLIVKKTSTSSVGDQVSDWPRLKMVDITVDSAMLAEVQCLPYRMPPRSTQVLLNFIFREFRHTVYHVRLCWIEEFTDKCKEKKIRIPIPRVGDILQCCLLLNKLELVNWPGKNKDLLVLFFCLEHLEELVVEKCKGLGNVAFVGEDVENPLFLRLKSLKKLTLGGLDKMPKITDTLFNLVLRHMKLTHLFISSEDKLTNVTAKGIRILLTGEFADSIEKFPFSGWSLANIDDDEFTNLKNQFRSSFMI